MPLKRRVARAIIRRIRSGAQSRLPMLRIGVRFSFEICPP